MKHSKRQTLNMRVFLYDVREQMKPKYHELTAYLTALTCIMMFITHSDFRQIYFELLNGADKDRAIPGMMFLTLIATLGFLCSPGHVFVKWQISSVMYSFQVFRFSKT